jgi:hypothetical protein
VSGLFGGVMVGWLVGWFCEEGGVLLFVAVFKVHVSQFILVSPKILLPWFSFICNSLTRIQRTLNM